MSHEGAVTKMVKMANQITRFIGYLFPPQDSSYSPHRFSPRCVTGRAARVELDAKVPRQVGLSGGSITLGLSPYFRCKSKEKAKHPRSELVCAVGERLNVCLKKGGPELAAILARYFSTLGG